MIKDNLLSQKGPIMSLFILYSKNGGVLSKQLVYFYYLESLKRHQIGTMELACFDYKRTINCPLLAPIIVFCPCQSVLFYDIHVVSKFQGYPIYSSLVIVPGLHYVFDSRTIHCPFIGPQFK